MKKKKFMIGAVVVIVLIFAISAIAYAAGDKLDSMKEKDFIVQSNLEMTEVSVISQTSGQIIELNIEEGDSITEGQLLAKIDSDTLMAQRQKAQAGIESIQGQLKSAQASYSKVQGGTRPEEEAQAKANYDLAEATYNRMKSLYDSGAISKADMDTTATQYEVAKQKYQLAQNGAQAQDIQMSAASIETLQGQLEGARASLAEIETYLSKTEIKAPATGIVTQLSIEKGGLVSGGMPIAVITDTSSPWVQCNVMENELDKVHLGQKVKIELGSYPDETFQGEVIAVNKSADFAVKRATNANGEFDILSYGVKVKPLNVKEQLFAGMTAFVNFGPGEDAKAAK